ncbi:hypothetical protein PSEUBRA_006122 [Kalmanozyma brasiliensis GHG001]|uniref:uncharacterized protein n=1 Tax=Kalmanozyma brasiliensis (strain GHG001) TaxID=1365824 RepID=UPI001CE7A56E|nr:uncharacterized protein PSEUBRA_006122 [Kalmanozyma brasiliensis GHG001]KAF6767620.1 hypothetical protein PSEUBRA_006122 [Kalmanozyma brasiliensis GHG001]
MAALDHCMGRKRTLSDPSSSSPSPIKLAKTASACSLPSSPSSIHLPPPCSATRSNSTTRSNGVASASYDSAKSSYIEAAPFSPRPFPRYALGIPHLQSLLPFRDGLELLHAYHQGVGWMQTPVDRTTLLETLEEAERHGADSIHPHRLACLLAALALGDFFSACFPSSASSASSPSSIARSSSTRGRIWFGVASACLAGSRSNADLIHNPTPEACSALYLMSTYLLCSNDEQLFHRSQGLTGLALILAKTILVPSCAPTSGSRSASPTASPSIASQRHAKCPATSSKAADTVVQDRLHCNKLLSDLIFHLRSQILTFAPPSSTTQPPSSPKSAPSLADFPDLPSIQAIWTAYGNPLYSSLDAFGSCYSPNIFHNWKLGLADLMHQVSTLTSQSRSPDHLEAHRCMPGGLPARTSSPTVAEHGRSQSEVTLPEHCQVVKLDERIRRYHASLPPFLLLHKPLPIEMAGKVDEDELAQIICQRHMACSMVHRMLMALHRPWFLSALAYRSRILCTRRGQQGTEAESTGTDASGSDCDTEGSDADFEASETGSLEQPSTSAVFSLSAVLRSATWQTETFASATACAPEQALAWWQFTNNALAAAIVQATALLRLPGPPKHAQPMCSRDASARQQSNSALQMHSQVRNDLDKNICSFQSLAKRCKLAAKALPFLQRVRSAIDLGACSSRRASYACEEALQGSISSAGLGSTQISSMPSPPPSPTDFQASNRISSDPVSRTCNPSNIHSPSSHQRNSNSNSNSNSINSIANGSSINIGSSRNVNSASQDDATRSNPHIINSNPIFSNRSTSRHPGHSISPTSAVTPQARSVGSRRNSSAKSDLETLFGPIASGLELNPHRESTSPVKPLYRQSFLEPLPRPSGLSRPSYDRASSDDAGSSSSSERFPYTPKARSLQLDAKAQPQAGIPSAAQVETSGTSRPEEGKVSGRKEPNQASDLVLECIRFWQPDTLPLPATH